MFNSLSDKISKILDSIRKKGAISESDFNQAVREIRIALLEADVALPVAKTLIEKLKERAIGEKVLSTLSPSQMIIKILNDLIIETLGTEGIEINLNAPAPAVILMVGLQGAGKTTSSAKLAHYISEKYKKKVMMASTDIYRPAAMEQLQVLGKKHNIPCLEIVSNEKPAEIATRAIKKAKLESTDVLIIDTAGRLHSDEELIQELIDLKKITNPIETILVADSLTGQDAVNIAREFNEKIGVTGIILTRIDGDARGGAAISMRQVTGAPIKFLATGEKISDFEVFHPDRIASRILDMGDISSLVEKAVSNIDKDEAEKLNKRLMAGRFDLNDFAMQLRQLKKMGGINSIMGFLPGFQQLKSKVNELNVNEKTFDWQIAIINSMTKSERANPKLINGSRRKRISIGSGRPIQEINQLLNNYEKISKVAKKFGKMDKKTLMRSGLGKLFS